MSLSPNYLAGRADAVEHRWYGPVDDLLHDLADASVESIELRAVGPDTDVALALDAAHRLRSAGFAMTIHGVLPPTGRTDEWQETVPAMIASVSATILAMRGAISCETVFVRMHPTISCDRSSTPTSTTSVQPAEPIGR